jgi:demethylmenaquinone methyltransferase/2-methoxy-6-polyprenyl-1,4-benzoquinol methylase
MLAAQVEERIWETEGERKRTMVREMFSEIAPKYDLMNSVMSLSLHTRWRSYVVSRLALRQGDSALDVCCGTGDFLAPLRKAVGRGRLLGLDFCYPMLEKARAKADASLGVADACRLPVRESSFDAVTVGWGIRNVPDIDLAHREISRVLKKGGRFASLDMAQPRNPLVRTASRFVFNSVVPRLGALLGSAKAYTYLPKSTERFWTREELAESMTRAGFVDVTYKDLFFGNICAHFGRKP